MTQKLEQDASTGGAGGASEEQFRLLVSSIKDYAIFMLDVEGHVTTWNAGAQRIKGYRPEEIIGKQTSIFYTPEDIAAQRPQHLLNVAIAEGRVEDEGWRVRKDGTRFWADVVITALRDPAGQLVGFAKVTRDLSTQKEAAEQLLQSKSLLAATLHSIGDAVLATDERARITLINGVAEHLTGFPRDEALGKPIHEVFDIINEETRAKVENPVARVLQDGVVVGLANHTALISRDGVERPIADSGAPIRDADGVTRGAVLVFRDVTEERRSEEALRKSESLLAATLRSIGDGVLVTDERACITMINPVAERLTGWVEEAATGRAIDDVFNIINEDTREKAANPVTRVLKEGIVVGLANHTALISNDGTERPIADSGAPIRDAEGVARGAVLVFRDVTEERRAEEALRQSEEKLRLMIASIHDYAIYMLDPAGHVVTWNPGAEKIKGYRADEIVGKDFSRFFSPEDIASGKPADELAAAAKNGRFEDESWRVRKDGTRFWANVVLGAIHDNFGRLVGFAKVTRDLTERRMLEDERVRVAHAQEAVRLRDEFLSIASHELKTPLTALQLQLRGVLDRVAPIETKLVSKLTKAMRASERLADLIEKLLDVSRIATGRLSLNPEAFDLVDVVHDVVEGVRDSATQAGCKLSTRLDGPVFGTWDRLRVEQILVNLLSNAIRYAAGTPVEVSLARQEEIAVIDVRDRGPGLPESDLMRVFQRFERANSMSHGGLGLGLYITRQIVEAHGGSVSAQNLQGGGACFVVRLPMGPSAETSAATRAH
jgi:PAS domain S-box-containing protein